MALAPSTVNIPRSIYNSILRDHPEVGPQVVVYSDTMGSQIYCPPAHRTVPKIPLTGTLFLSGRYHIVQLAGHYVSNMLGQSGVPVIRMTTVNSLADVCSVHVQDGPVFVKEAQSVVLWGKDPSIVQEQVGELIESVRLENSIGMLSNLVNLPEDNTFSDGLGLQGGLDPYSAVHGDSGILWTSPPQSLNFTFNMDSIRDQDSLPSSLSQSPKSAAPEDISPLLFSHELDYESSLVSSDIATLELSPLSSGGNTSASDMSFFPLTPDSLPEPLPRTVTKSTSSPTQYSPRKRKYEQEPVEGAENDTLRYAKRNSPVPLDSLPPSLGIRTVSLPDVESGSDSDSSLYPMHQNARKSRVKQKPTTKRKGKSNGAGKPERRGRVKETPSYCPYCSQRCTRKQDLTRHLENSCVRCPPSVSKRTSYPCPKCPELLSRIDALTRHLKNNSCGKSGKNKRHANGTPFA